MMHFTDAYCAEASNKPCTAIRTLKHLRRYTARNILQHAESPTLDNKTKDQLTLFVSKLSHALSPFPRFLIGLHQRFLITWYDLNTIFAAAKSKKTHRLHAEISRIFVTELKK